MQESVDAIRVALRVLAALTEYRNPDPEDVEKLHQLAPPTADASLDEMACAVVEEALKRRREKYKRAKSGGL